MATYAEEMVTRLETPRRENVGVQARHIREGVAELQAGDSPNRPGSRSQRVTR